MMSKRCSDVVESRVEHAILDAGSRRNAASISAIRNSPDALTLGARGLLTTTRCGEPVPPVSDLGDLSTDYIMVSPAALPRRGLMKVLCFRPFLLRQVQNH